jgi:hypothetical protein
MDARLVEQCAKALWDRWQKDPANQYKVFKKYGRISWQQINEVDMIPSLADDYRDKAKVVIREVRRWVAANSINDSDMLDLFLAATMNGE